MIPNDLPPDYDVAATEVAPPPAADWLGGMGSHRVVARRWLLADPAWVVDLGQTWFECCDVQPYDLTITHGDLAWTFDPATTELTVDEAGWTARWHWRWGSTQVEEVLRVDFAGTAVAERDWTGERRSHRPVREPQPVVERHTTTRWAWTDGTPDPVKPRVYP